MARDRDIERAFERDVECLLSGEEPSGAPSDTGYEETLILARRLLALRDDPDEGFATRLRTRLLVQMAEQDRDAPATEGSWFERLFSRPALRLTVVSTFVILAAVGLVWRAGYFSPMAEQAGDAATSEALDEGGAPAPMLEEAGPEMARVADEEAEEEAPMAPSAEKASPVQIGARSAPVYAFGETVDITLVFENTGQEGVTLAPFPPTIDIRSIETGEVVKSLPEGQSSLALSSMESTTYQLQWNQQTTAGTQATAGRYALDVHTVQAVLEKGDSVQPAGEWDVVRFEILPPGGNG
jgi:hypothetical protein